MARLEDGVKGFMTGKVGAITFYKRGNKYYSRQSITQNTSNTESQKRQRGRFQVAIKAFSPMKDVFRVGFASQVDGARTGFNAGVGFNMRNALVLENGDYVVDWSLVACSMGQLPMLEQVVVEGSVEGGIVARWSTETGCASADGRDEVCMAVYDHESAQCWFSGTGAAQRMDGELKAEPPKSFAGHALEVYLFAVSRRGDTASSTSYAGQLL